MVIANGTTSDYVIRQVLDGRKVGTFFTMVEETGPSVENQAAGGMWIIFFAENSDSLQNRLDIPRTKNLEI